jgi:methyl-accepting chemotaxis protein
MAWLRRFLTTGRARWVALSIALTAVLATALIAGGDPRAPGDLDELERASEAGSEAQLQSERITQNLERIAENLEDGAQLEEASSEIHELTEKQRESLSELADVLRGQLASIRRSSRFLERSSESAAGVERIGDVESRRIRRTLAALRSLERATRSAVTRSANLARQAIYGARLAEDSADAFERP